MFRVKDVELPLVIGARKVHKICCTPSVGYLSDTGVTEEGTPLARPTIEVASFGYCVFWVTGLLTQKNRRKKYTIFFYAYYDFRCLSRPWSFWYPVDISLFFLSKPVFLGAVLTHLQLESRFGDKITWN